MGLKSIKYKDFEIWYSNQKEFETLFHEIFVSQIYRFDCDKPIPRIVDCGSHIGLSVLYFKTLYPDSEILAFEPDRESFSILEKNIRVNNLKNVEVFNMALNDSKGLIPFYCESSPEWDSCGNSTVREWGDRTGFRTDNVDGVLLSDYISTPVDFLKMDIEGAEWKVLNTITNKLHLIKEIVLEYHICNKESKNILNDVLKVLQDNYKTVTHSSFNLNSIMPDRYKDWVEKYNPVICNIRGKNA